MPVPPPDDWERQLRDNVAPAGWHNPRPGGRYNLVVIGAGTAGLVCAAGAAGLTALAFRAQTAYAQPGASTGDASAAPTSAVVGGAPSGGSTCATFSVIETIT